LEPRGHRALAGNVADDALAEDAGAEARVTYADWMRTFSAALLLLLTACASSTSSPPPATTPAEPPIVTSTAVSGRGYPFGDSAMTPYMHLTTVATSPYGYSAMSPVKVGGGLGEGSRNEQLYLGGL